MTAPSYDKNKKLLTIGELPKSDNYNPVKFPLFEGDSKYPAAFVNLTKIRFINGKERRDWNINQTAILGIMPVIIAPKQIADDLRKNYLPNMTTVNTTKYEFFTDKEKFFTDIYYKDEKRGQRQKWSLIELHISTLTPSLMKMNSDQQFDLGMMGKTH